MDWGVKFQNGTNFYDGTTGITECGIPPGQFLVYKCVPGSSLLSPLLLFVGGVLMKC